MNSKDDYTKKDTLKGNIWDANWTVNIDHQHNEVQIFTDEKVNYTWFFTIGTITPENELIARLIAAAPKMLKFLVGRFVIFLFSDSWYLIPSAMQ